MYSARFCIGKKINTVKPLELPDFLHYLFMNCDLILCVQVTDTDNII